MNKHLEILRVLVLLVVSVHFLLSCNKPGEPIQVKQLPMKVETKYLDDLKEGEKKPVHSHERAVTDWKFGCKVDFQFEVVDQTQLAREFLTTVKVNKVNIQLDAPVVIWLPEDADEKLIAHENAHVEICKKFYGTAKKDALEAAKKVVDKKFQGSGKSQKKSIKKALSIANREVCDYYHLNMSEKIDRVSEIFDSLDGSVDKPSDQLIEMAFKQFRVVKSDK